MNTIIYDLTTELSGQDYKKLLNYGLKFCSHFILVLRSKEYYSDFPILNELENFLTSRSEENEWPGTLLLDGDDESKATILKYTYDYISNEILQRYASSLYAWRYPNLPEDLCLLRSSEDPWLTTIAHENDAYLTITEEEYTELIKEIPILKGYLKRHI